MMQIDRRQAGFTLVEVLIAIFITALAFTGMFAAIHTAINMEIFVREMSDAEQVGPAILSQVSEDLRNAYFYNVVENDFFEARAVEIADGFRADQIHFITTRASLLADPLISAKGAEGDDWASPLNEVSYLCKEGGDGYWQLHRREQNFVDDDPFKGGYYRMITDRLESLKIQCTGYNFGGDSDSPFGSSSNTNGDQQAPATISGQNSSQNSSNNESTSGDGLTEGEDQSLVWEDSWSAKQKGALPVAVKIELVVAPQIDPEVMRRMQRGGQLDRLRKSYVHIVLLPQFREDRDLMMETSNWDGTVAEPASTGGGVAGGARGRNQQGGGLGGNRNNRNGNQQQGGNQQGGGNNPFLDALRRGGNGGGGGNNNSGGGSNPFQQILQGGGRR